MDWFIKAFIRASLLWFAAGIVLGLAMAIHPAWVVYRPAHAHMNVAGFLTFLVFGVGYQLLPRLFGAPLYSRRMAIAHLYLANLGLAGLVFGFLTPRLGGWRNGMRCAGPRPRTLTPRGGATPVTRRMLPGIRTARTVSLWAASAGALRRRMRRVRYIRNAMRRS